MKSLLLALLLSGTMLWAQSNTPQTPPAGSQSETSAGTAQNTRRARGMNMSAMHQQMIAMVQQMGTHLDKMKADIANIKDPAAKDAAQQNYEMWQTMYTHMQQMQANMGQGMMSHGTGMGMGMGHGTGMGMGQPPAGTSTKKPPAQTPPPQR